jgi:hypothetical protein
LHSRGIVLLPSDLDFAGWSDLLQAAGLNLLGLHSESLTSEQQAVVEACRQRGIDIEYHLHFVQRFMDKQLFAAQPQWFAMDVLGRRDPHGNPCVSAPGLLDHARGKAAHYTSLYPSTTHRYHYWAADNKIWCHCPECCRYSPSEQNTMLMQAFLDGIRQVDAQGTIAYLAYLETLPVPERIKPGEGLFLEFAPYRRVFTRPLDDTDCHANRQHIAALDRLLQVFDTATACVLEYWLDVSYWSNYLRPAQEVRLDGQFLERDIELYRSRGLNNVTTFACWMDDDYLVRWGSAEVVRYGRALAAR